MNNHIHYSQCPVCGSAEIKHALTIQDHSVSGESFHVYECSSCSLRFTQDVPDPASISPYYKSENYISHTDTSKGLVNRIYKMVRRSMMKRKRKLVEESTGVEEGQLLELGSGTGSFVLEMKRHGWDVTGLEPDEDARRTARELHQLDLADGTEFYKLNAGSFDAITMWHVLEHVHDLSPYVQQLKNVLKENGRLLIAVPNYTSLDAEIYGESWAAYDVPRHLYHFSPRSMAILMARHGLKLSQHKALWYDSYYISLLSSKYKNGHTNWVGAIWNGFRSNLRAVKDAGKCSSVIYIISK